MINSLLQTLSIGPVNLPWIIIPLFIAWIIYQVSIKRFYRDRTDFLQTVDRLMFNSLFVLLVAWKISPLVFQFSTVIKNPMAALYLPGGPAGVVLGVVAAIAYGTVSVLKHKEARAALVKSLGLNLGFLLVLMLVLSLGTAALLSGRADSSADSAAPGAVTGTEAPGFTLSGQGGEVYKLSDYKGQRVVINFWASWCPPCRAELPELKTFYSESDSDELAFLSINLYTSERDPAALPAFIEDEELTFPVLFDLSGEAAAAYGVKSIPTTVVIGRDGIISAVKTGAVTNAWLKRAAAD